MTNTTDNSPSKKYKADIKFYIVALIDVLGQKQELAKWKNPPNTKEDKKRFLEAFGKSFGVVMKLREDSIEYTNEWKTGYAQTEEGFESMPDKGKELLKFREFEIKFMHFSDTIVIYSSLENKHGYNNVTMIMMYFNLCSHLLLSRFHYDSAIRGAIDIGTGAELEQEDLYGPALASVHDLESKVAKYPRIVIGSDLIEYLNVQKNNKEITGAASVNRVQANTCLNLIAKDNHGVWIIDYLNDAHKSLHVEREGIDKLQQSSFEFAIRQLQKFRDAGDKILTPRYEKLVSYFHSRGFK